MLPESHHVEGVYRGPDGIFANAKAGATFIDASTISPISAQALAAEAAEAGFTLMDTPVSGGTMGAMTVASACFLFEPFCCEFASRLTPMFFFFLLLLPSHQAPSRAL